MPIALVVVFVVLPIVEILVILQVGAVIGGWSTVALLVLDSLVGAWLVRREGARAFRALREALGRGAVPSREIADGALVLVGGTLLLTPGFVTDALGVLLLLPFTRPFLRALLVREIGRRMLGAGSGFLAGMPVRPGQQRPGTRPHPGAEPPRGAGPVVPGEVVDDQG